ncbi:MAG: NAD-dependent protein deacetylase [Ectothiorhodospiraceae bacterium]|nr:NAD-dependent protein deacetylase [Ectothiorhodospiraceae bacterium]
MSGAAATPLPTRPGAARLAERLAGCGHALALTGAGCSTDSGIPDYRDRCGAWKRKPPVQIREFLRSSRNRKRYWARSMLGWPQVAGACPGASHRALAALEAHGLLRHLITQNVDGLHQRAGSHAVTDLHGRLDRVSCLDCGAPWPRRTVQGWLEDANPDWLVLEPRRAPDGDVDLEGVDFDAFREPHCPSCGGLLKPDVVFFGENVAPPVVEDCFRRLQQADVLLVVGSSLMVWSGYRFVRAAAAQGKPVLIVNRGRTRGEREASLVVDGDCAGVLSAMLTYLGVNAGEGFHG